MAKHRSRSERIQGPAGRSLTVQLPLPVLGVLGDTREAFHALCIRTGQEVLMAMMEAEREALCGPKGPHQEHRRAWRGGSSASRVTLGGRQVELPRLRVRDGHGEVGLASLRWAASTEAMDAHTMSAVAAGVSMRHYPRTLDPLPQDLSEHATSRSAVSRRFVALSRQKMEEFLSRALGELDIAVVFIDAKGIIKNARQSAGNPVVFSSRTQEKNHDSPGPWKEPPRRAHPRSAFRPVPGRGRSAPLV